MQTIHFSTIREGDRHFFSSLRKSPVTCPDIFLASQAFVDVRFVRPRAVKAQFSRKLTVARKENGNLHGLKYVPNLAKWLPMLSKTQ